MLSVFPQLHTRHLPIWGAHILVSYFLPFHTVHGVLVARTLEWFAIPSSSGPRFVRTLQSISHRFIELHKPLHYDKAVIHEYV